MAGALEDSIYGSGKPISILFPAVFPAALPVLHAEGRETAFFLFWKWLTDLPTG
ncbi:hypothetical protein [Pseudarthrobacter sp. LMD1-1-1.1]|uniref:hypothetical protein n=1 Tax=Pseudarthrobacter sp. LMD1-1-1.1 TaxID=3135242 RepID=UPI00343AABC6